jgi:hypothetical protein
LDIEAASDLDAEILILIDFDCSVAADLDIEAD